VFDYRGSHLSDSPSNNNTPLSVRLKIKIVQNKGLVIEFWIIFFVVGFINTKSFTSASVCKLGSFDSIKSKLDKDTINTELRNHALGGINMHLSS
jgi:hypothetical protein